MQGHEFDKWSLCISCGRWYAGSWGGKRTKGAFMPGGLPRNPDIVFGIGQNLTVRWPRIATRKKLKSGASRFHWLGLHLVKRTQRPLAIEQSWQEMQWNKILDEYWLKCQINFKKVPFAKWLSATVVLFDDIQCCLRVANGIWLWWYSMQWKSSLELMTCVQLDRAHC